MTTIQLLGICGSIRKQSANKAVLEALRLRLAERGTARMTIFGLADLPLFNCDLETADLPAPIRAFQDAVRATDGLVLSSPEYNHGTSGVLKNALDWASRPPHDAPLKGKPALIMTAASSMLGGVRAIHQVRDTLVSCHARVIARPDVIIAKVHEKIRDGKLVDEPTLTFALQAIDDLLAEIRMLATGRPR